MNSQYYKNETLNMSLKYKDFKLLSHNLFICKTNSLLQHFMHHLKIKKIMQKCIFKSVLNTNSNPVMDDFMKLKIWKTFQLLQRESLEKVFQIDSSE